MSLCALISTKKGEGEGCKGEQKGGKGGKGCLCPRLSASKAIHVQGYPCPRLSAFKGVRGEKGAHVGEKGAKG